MNISHSKANISLTVEQEELLICLLEEASEVTHIVAKILRFGLDSYHPRTGATNSERLHAEVGDFLALVERLTELGVLSADKLDTATEAKLIRLENYLLCQGDTDLVV